MATMRDIHEGMTVYSADDKKLGKVTRCGKDSFVIEKGLFFHKDFSARYDLIKEIRDDSLYLSARQVDMSEGTYVPEGTSKGAATTTTSTGIPATGAGATSTTAAKTGAFSTETRVPLAEEQLEIEKRTRSAGAVEVRKDVITETKTVEVPVTREEVYVERVPAESGARAGEETFKPGTKTIPLQEEEVVVHKRPVVKEEVRVTKGARQEQRAVAADVRREEVDIEERGTPKSASATEDLDLEPDIDDPNKRRL